MTKPGEPLNWDTLWARVEEKMRDGKKTKEEAITEVLREHHRDCLLCGKGAVCEPKRGREGK